MLRDEHYLAKDKRIPDVWFKYGPNASFEQYLSANWSIKLLSDHKNKVEIDNMNQSTNVVKGMTEKDACSRVLGRERGANWLEGTNSAESTNTSQLDQFTA